MPAYAFPPTEVIDRESPGRRPDSPELLAAVFDGFPFGILVLDSDRRLLAANPAARELLGHSVSLTPGASCCSVLGCGQPGGPLEDACLGELAAHATGHPPEIRIDLPAENPAGALWVTVASVGDDSSYLVFELRTGQRGDRRQRTDPHWLPARGIHLRVLGRTTVESADGHIGGSWVGQRAGQLLKYLVAERDRSVPAEEVAAALWRGGGATTLNTLRHYVHVLRERLEPEREKRTESSFVLARSSGYSLDRRRIHIDADLFEQHVRTGAAAYLSGEEATAIRSLEDAMGLYRGDFLADEPYAEWAFAERDRLRALAGRACRMLTESAAGAGDLEAAARHCERLAALELFDDEVQRAVLILALRRGRRSEAMRLYGTMRQRMLAEFGEELPFDLPQLIRDVDEPLRLL